MDKQTEDPITKCPQRTVQAGGIKTKRIMRDWLQNLNEFDKDAYTTLQVLHTLNVHCTFCCVYLGDMTFDQGHDI